MSFSDLEDGTNTNDDIIFPEEIYNLKQGNFVFAKVSYKDNYLLYNNINQIISLTQNPDDTNDTYFNVKFTKWKNLKTY